MKIMFRAVALAALICNYMTLAVDSAAIIDDAESHEEEEHMGTHDVENPDPHHSDDSHITINDAELPVGEASTGTHDHHPDSEEYHARMQEISRLADEEESNLHKGEDGKGEAAGHAHPENEAVEAAEATKADTHFSPKVPTAVGSAAASSATIDNADAHEGDSSTGMHHIEHPDHHPDSDHHKGESSMEMDDMQYAHHQDSDVHHDMANEHADLHEGEALTGAHDIDHPHHPDSVEYQKQMEEISRLADQEGAAQDSKGAATPKVAHPLEEGMHVAMPTDEEEYVLPSKHPVINPDMTHVSYVVENDPSSVHVNIEYSFFKGADEYELCANCLIKDGIRGNTQVGDVKSFNKGDDFYCEIGPACFSEFIWKTGAHSFSIRARTVEGWTMWSPTVHFHIESVVGMMTHIQHNEL